MKPLAQLRRAWRLYRTDNRLDTLLAVALVGTVAYPLVRVWWQMRRSGGD